MKRLVLMIVCGLLAGCSSSSSSAPAPAGGTTPPAGAAKNKGVQMD